MCHLIIVSTRDSAGVDTYRVVNSRRGVILKAFVELELALDYLQRHETAYFIAASNTRRFRYN